MQMLNGEIDDGDGDDDDCDTCEPSGMLRGAIFHFLHP